MTQQTITAIYANGVLRPLVSLDLPENSEVELDVKVVENKQSSHRQIRELLIKKGLSLPKKTTKWSRNLSSEERERLAEIFSVPQELGELIDEDREERF